MAGICPRARHIPRFSRKFHAVYADYADSTRSHDRETAMTKCTRDNGAVMNIQSSRRVVRLDLAG